MKNKESQAKESCMLLRPTEHVSLIFTEHLVCTRHSPTQLTYMNSFNKEPWEIAEAPPSISRCRNRGRERFGKLSNVVELGFEPGYTGSGTQAVSHCTVLQEEKYKGQDCSSERVP